MALWQKVKQLNSNATKQILQTYSTNNIPIEVRDICSVWIEGSINCSSAEKFCIGLRKQLQEKLSPNSPSYAVLPFYVIGRLTELQYNLNTGNAAVFQDIYNRLQTCLEIERSFVSITSQNQVPNCSLATQVSLPNTTPTTHHSTPFAPLNCSTINATILPFSPQNGIVDDVIDDYNAEEFLCNPLRITMDGEMNSILEAVWSLEETSNNFSIRCHELKQLQELNQPQALGNQSISLQEGQVPPQFQRQQIRIREIRHEILQMATKLHCKIREIRSCSMTVLHNWNQLKVHLDMDISAWTIEQKLNANGKPILIRIRRLQALSEYLMEVAWKLRGHLITTDKVCENHRSVLVHYDTRDGSTSPTITDQTFTVTSLIKNLVQDSFLVTHQPCQVLKTNTRFHILPGQNPMEICLLVGDKLGLQISPPTVAVCIVDENACKEIKAKGLEGESFRKVIKKGRLLPDATRLDFCQDKKCSSAVFRQISLKDFYRNARKGPTGREQAELVNEEKFSLLFRSEFSVGGINFQVWRLSLPIVIITHGSQESLAWASVTWDNAFSSNDRIPFQLPDYVSWEGVSEMLNGRFTSLVGAPLTQENTDYFAERLSIYDGFPEKLTWFEICKNYLPGRKFTFWEWFYEGAKLIEQHLKEAWKDGHVKGFIGKESSENMLCNSGCLPGTFLLRFSESTLGAISIVWLHSDGSAYSLLPFKSKDLTLQPLVEKLDQETLHYVFPSTEKREAFNTYYEEYDSATRSDDSGEGSGVRYVKVKNQLVLVAPDIPRFDRNTLEQRSDNVSNEQQDPSETSLISPQTDELAEFFIDELLSSSYSQDPTSGESDGSVLMSPLPYEPSFYLEL